MRTSLWRCQSSCRSPAHQSLSKDLGSLGGGNAILAPHWLEPSPSPRFKVHDRVPQAIARNLLPWTVLNNIRVTESNGNSQQSFICAPIQNSSAAICISSHSAPGCDLQRIVSKGNPCGSKTAAAESGKIMRRRTICFARKGFGCISTPSGQPKWKSQLKGASSWMSQRNPNCQPRP
jgi:hypothetical protein